MKIVALTIAQALVMTFYPIFGFTLLKENNWIGWVFIGSSFAAAFVNSFISTWEHYYGEKII